MDSGSNFKISGAEALDKLSHAKTDDTPMTPPGIVRLPEDLKFSIEAKAPPVESPYSMANSTCDLPCAAYALELFLSSHMLESEDYIHKGDPKK
jgi:hypothetical protein